MDQLSLFDALRQPPVMRPVEPSGTVVQGEIDETLTLPHPRLAWPLARIELHQHVDGLWMWSVSMAGGGYRVGPKWGKFAQSRDDARSYACDELLERCARVRDCASILMSPVQLGQIQAWARGLK
ncbi:hypothetical protein [Paracoccus sp. pheM1]|uniref:hypothetical protein n=1 Tax=Paracoccus sp. pheM1 TaxID=2831675 RepID=UPI001BDB8A27|nr:hypothetical protein [Paracoccus sp. pheM1]MBT0780551.1 hypothetical protein [Paracoccus sp. pheM1]